MEKNSKISNEDYKKFIYFFTNNIESDKALRSLYYIAQSYFLKHPTCDGGNTHE